MISIILIEPETSGNIGYVSRAMKNFGFKELILINPKCNHLNQVARNRAKHAQEVLRNAKVLKKMPKMDCMIATTSITGTKYNPRSPLTPAQLAQITPKNQKIGLVFGPEGTGLRNEEVLAADFVVTIPAACNYPTLNISQAAAILFYELFEKEKTIHELATAKDKEVLLMQPRKPLKNN